MVVVVNYGNTTLHRKKHVRIDSIKVDGTLVNNSDSMVGVFNIFL